LIIALADKDPAVRYWAATSVGNIGKEARHAAGKMRNFLKNDSSTVVRIAAARAILRMNTDEPAALKELKKALQSPEQWSRLHAAIALDEADEQARPAIPALKKALNNQPNKYITRVANKALNDLLGTQNKVK
jgi:HEAT repeat protein